MTHVDVAVVLQKAVMICKNIMTPSECCATAILKSGGRGSGKARKKKRT